MGALRHFAARHGLAFAPHAKTTMSPQLVRAQLDAGAWGITAATASQVLVHRSHGVPRVLLANELTDPAGAAWTAGQQSGAHRCQPRGRALHKRAVGDQRHQRGFRRADLGYLVSVTHAA